MKKSSCATKKYAVGGAVAKKPAVKKPVKKFAVGGFAGQLQKAADAGIAASVQKSALDAANTTSANAVAAPSPAPSARALEAQPDIDAGNAAIEAAKRQQAMPPPQKTARALANEANFKKMKEYKASIAPTAEEIAKRNAAMAAKRAAMGMDKETILKKVAENHQRQREEARKNKTQLSGFQKEEARKNKTQRFGFDSTMPVNARPYTGSTPTRYNENPAVGAGGPAPAVLNKGGAVAKKPVKKFAVGGSVGLDRSGSMTSSGLPGDEKKKSVMPKKMTASTVWSRTSGNSLYGSPLKKRAVVEGRDFARPYAKGGVVKKGKK